MKLKQGACKTKLTSLPRGPRKAGRATSVSKCWAFGELVRLSRAGVDRAKSALDRLREITRRRGPSDLLEEYLRSALESEMKNQ